MNTVKRLWNKNFAILWQGQLISDLGNAIFSVTLGFWVLGVTATPEMPGGDLSLMGLIMAVFVLPEVVLGPFAGAVADRLNRKWIIITADIIRGLLFAAMGAMLLWNVFPFWVIYPLAALSGAAGAFFSPAISSAIPDIVPKESLSKANSARGFSMTLSQLLGNSLGGFLFAVFSAPLLILVNGISFLYASVSQLFMKLPFEKKARKEHILRDMTDGVKYAFKTRGIRILLITGMLIDFFAMIGIVLMTPLFNSTPGFGVEKYGLMMGAMMAGAVTGMLTFSAVRIKPDQRSKIFGISVIALVCATIPLGFIYNVSLMYPLAFLVGISNSIINVMLQTIMQSTVPSGSRGKVFGIMGTVMGGLQPLAMAFSGVIAGFFGVRATIVAAFSILVFVSLPLLFSRHFRQFINTDADEKNEEEGVCEAVYGEKSLTMLPDED